MNTKSKGNIAEAKVLSAFVANNIPVCIPFGDNEKYDLVIQHNCAFKSVQVKLAHYELGSVKATTTYRTGAARRGYGKYAGLVDYIALYCLELDKVYLLPAEDCNYSVSLRIDAPANNQAKFIKHAEDYTISSILGL